MFNIFGFVETFLQVTNQSALYVSRNGSKREDDWNGTEGQKAKKGRVSNWSLTSCQPHRVTSGRMAARDKKAECCRVLTCAGNAQWFVWFQRSIMNGIYLILLIVGKSRHFIFMNMRHYSFDLFWGIYSHFSLCRYASDRGPNMAATLFSFPFFADNYLRQSEWTMLLRNRA